MNGIESVTIKLPIKKKRDTNGCSVEFYQTFKEKNKTNYTQAVLENIK